MILSVIEYGDIIYAGTSIGNLHKIDKLFYRGLRICLGFNFRYNENELCNECNLASLVNRRKNHLLMFMCKLKVEESRLKKTGVNTHLQTAPVFWYYKPNNEKFALM